MSDIVNSLAKFSLGWHGGLPETPCGSGSKLANTVKQREWIPQVIDRYQIRTIADIGAGDLNWIKETDLRGAHYTAYDLVPRWPTVVRFDLLSEPAPSVDLLMVLWVLNHLPFAQCRRAIENIKRSGSRYLMMTDRPRWHAEQPPEIMMDPVLEQITLNEKGDSIKLVALC